MSESKDSMTMKKIHKRKHKSWLQTRFKLFKVNTDQNGLKCNISGSIKHLQKT